MGYVKNLQQPNPGSDFIKELEEFAQDNLEKIRDKFPEASNVIEALDAIAKGGLRIGNSEDHALEVFFGEQMGTDYPIPAKRVTTAQIDALLKYGPHLPKDEVPIPEIFNFLAQNHSDVPILRNVLFNAERKEAGEHTVVNGTPADWFAERKAILPSRDFY